MSSLQYIADPSKIDLSFSFDGMKAGGYSEDDLYAAGATTFPAKLRIPRSEWDDRIALQDKFKSAAIDYSARFTHQGNSHECVTHASIQAFEAAYNRQFASLLYAIYFAPLSLYTRITGGRQWGGSVVNDALREMMSRGLLPEHDGPEWLGGKGGQAKKFKATIHQTSGRSEEHWPTKGWITERQFPEGWLMTARHFRVLEAFYIPDREAHASALLHGFCVVNGRQGHSIPHMKLVKSEGRYLSKYRDSYNTDRYDSESLWGGGYCIASVTAPDDPKIPAGSDMRQAA